MDKIDIGTIKEAYCKLKSYVYYDNFNLILRSQLANFEADTLDEKLNILLIDINNYIEKGEISERLQLKIRDINYFAIPKSFSSPEKNIKKNYISNKETSNYSVERASLLFHGDIELHLISTLWIIREGFKLNEFIGNDNYGYHLPVNSRDEKWHSEKLLFTKYFDKYQEWRDKGIKSAKQQIKEGNDVMLISLDVKNFFHSTDIIFSEVKKAIGIEDEHSLTDLLEAISLKYTEIIASVEENNKERKGTLLPIGLVSSGVIANWFLCEFDAELKEKTSPVYYGRYVDDIFIVVSNVKEPKINNKEDDAHAIINWLADKYFYDKKPLLKKEEGKDIKFVFADERYKGLEIQSSKIKLFYFSPKWPLAMLNKFQKALEENSSAFWFLPDEEEMKNSLDDEAYDMQYEDTINKFRSISDIKASKYGASVFLAKKIKLAILQNSIADDKITEEVFRFFKGQAKVTLFNMWEKVFTYLVVTNDLSSIHRLYNEIIFSIDKISHANENIEKLLKEDLRRYLDISIQLALSLNPKIFDSLISNEKFKINKDNYRLGISNLRYSLLTRHHYLIFPFLIITKYYTETNESVLANGLFNRLMSSDDFIINDTIINDKWRIPRWIYFQEINILYLFVYLKRFEKDYLFYYENENKYAANYLNESIALFNKVNSKNISGFINIDKFKQFVDEKQIKIYTDSITITEKSDKDKLKVLKVGLSNFKILNNEIAVAISEDSKIYKEKRIKHIKLLNNAETEKVDLLILPETCVPIDWLYAYSDESRRKDRAFIFGLEHFSVHNYCFNLSMCILPIKYGKITDSIVIPRLKNHYSPSENKTIQTYGKKIPKLKSDIYHLINWRNVQFTIYNCYELTDITHRSIFRSELDVVFAIEYNKDINYFSNIAESTSRDLHCYFIQANTSNYGDSRVVEPRETVRMNPVRVKGGENNVILKYNLNIEELRNFQIKRLPHQLDDKSFKTTPPNFDHEKVKKREK